MAQTQSKTKAGVAAPSTGNKPSGTAAATTQPKDGKPIMQFQMIPKNEIPAAAGARGSGPKPPSVLIGEGGQMIYSKATTDALGGANCKFIAMGWLDQGNRVFGIQGLTELPKGEDEAKYFKPNVSKKGGHLYYGAGAFLGHERVGYDYRATGKKSFPVTVVDPGQKLLSIVLPLGATTGDPVVPRRKPVAKTNGQEAPAGQTGTPQGSQTPARAPQGDLHLEEDLQPV